MKEQIKKRWVKVLRSGEYEQGHDFLHEEKSFCCLGVLYDIEFDGYWKKSEYGTNRWRIEGQGDDIDDDGHLSENFRERCGISRIDQRWLIQLNDDDDISFKGIADWIEENM